MHNSEFHIYLFSRLRRNWWSSHPMKLLCVQLTTSLWYSSKSMWYSVLKKSYIWMWYLQMQWRYCSLTPSQWYQPRRIDHLYCKTVCEFLCVQCISAGTCISHTNVFWSVAKYFEKWIIYLDFQVIFIDLCIYIYLQLWNVFFFRCTLKGEEDYRSLFENFVYDLLSTVNKPEWPAAELLLSLLGRLLVSHGACGLIQYVWISSLWPSDIIWRQGSRSTLDLVMACCLTAPSHYLNQC